MILPTILSASALALTVNAFLVPLEIADEAQALKEPAFLVHNQPHTVKVNCSSCPYALNSERNGIHEWTVGVKNDLVLLFTSVGKSLTVNDMPFYPIQPSSLPGPVFAKQVKTDESAEDMKKWEGYTGDLRLSYSLEFDTKKMYPTESEDNPMMVSKILMTIMGIDDQMINIDNIEVTALEERNGDLHIGSVTTVPASPNAGDAKCSTIFCRVFAKIITKVSTVTKPVAHKIKCFCTNALARLHRYLVPSTVSVDSDTLRRPTHNHFRQGKFHGHKGHHHGWMHHMLKGMKRGFTFVVLPVLIGVAFGFAASAVGMLIGNIVVFFWLRRRRNNAAAISNGEGYERLESAEKEGLPAYEELEGVEVVLEKEGEQKV